MSITASHPGRLGASVSHPTYPPPGTFSDVPIHQQKQQRRAGNGRFLRRGIADVRKDCLRLGPARQGGMK
jgi:hypothetical protein